MLGNQYYVYIHKRLDTGAIFYVGKGKKNRAFTKVGRNNYWKNIVNKAGFEAFIVLDELSDEASKEQEVLLIDCLKKEGFNLCNMTAGGDGASGYKHTDEIKKKISNFHKGRIFSEEHKQRMRKPKSENGRKAIAQAHKTRIELGYRPSKESNLKRSQTLKNRTFSLSHKEKISNSLKNIPKPKVTCPHCNKIGGNGLMQRWHFDNCREITNAS